MSSSPQRPSIGGAAVVAGAFLVDLIGFGAIYSHAAFAEDIAAAFDAPRGAVAITFALATATCFFVGALSGPLADRFGARSLALAGMLVLASGLAVAARAESLAGLHLGYGVLVGLGAGLAHVPAMAAVQRRFVRRRGLASGLAACGVGVGIVLVPPMSEFLLAEGSWRSAFETCAVLAAVVGTAAASMLSGAPAAAARQGPERQPASARKRALASAYGGTLLVSVAATLPFVLLVGTARDLGIARHDAVALVGLIGIGTILGRITLASLADTIGRREVFLLSCAGMAAATALWPLAAERTALGVFAVAFGAVQGGFVSLLPAFVTDRFGADAIGRRLGLFFTGRGIALLCAPPAVVAGAELSGGMAAPLLAVAALAALGTVLLAAVGGPSVGAMARGGMAAPRLPRPRPAAAALMSQMVRPPMRDFGPGLRRRSDAAN